MFTIASDATDVSRATGRVLIAGTEADLESIRTVVALLGERARGQVFVEVQSESDIEPLLAPGRFSVSWLVRDRGQALRRSLDAWLAEMLPVSAFGSSSVYSWVAADGPARLLTSD